jgi:hypothetical protein
LRLRVSPGEPFVEVIFNFTPASCWCPGNGGKDEGRHGLFAKMVFYAPGRPDPADRAPPSARERLLTIRGIGWWR